MDGGQQIVMSELFGASDKTLESNRSDREKTFGIFRTIETQFTVNGL